MVTIFNLSNYKSNLEVGEPIFKVTASICMLVCVVLIMIQYRRSESLIRD